MATATTHGHIGVVTGAALYVGALIGPGLLLVPALAIFGVVLASNALGLRISAPLQLMLSSLLVVVLAIAIAFALPTIRGAQWVPFAPHGWLAIGTAANILIWLFVGWEAVAQF